MRLMNLQTIETKDTDSIISGLIRLSCEVGTPKHFLVDKDSAILKALQEAEIPIKDVKGICEAELKLNSLPALFLGTSSADLSKGKSIAFKKWKSLGQGGYQGNVFSRNGGPFRCHHE